MNNRPNLRKLLLLMVAAILVFSGCTKPEPVETTPTTPSTTVGETFTVAFLAPDGSLVFEDTVPSGEPAQPPMNPIMPYGYIFSHWDKDFSRITGDLTVNAVCSEISSKDNVFSCSGGYVQKGANTSVSVKLGGNVNLCAFNLRITYDKEMLDFVEFRSQDPLVDCNCMEENGTIYLNYASSENTVGDVDLTDLVFRACGDAGQASVTIEVLEIIVYDENYDFQTPACTTVPATITVAEG